MDIGEKKSKHGGMRVVTLVIIVVSLVLFVQAFKNGLGLSSSQKGIREYNSIDGLLSDNDWIGYIPDIVKNDTNLKIKVTMCQFVEIDGDNTVFKAGPYVTKKSDILALYENSEFDKGAKVKNKDYIDSIRLRTGYKKLEHCSIVNWYHNNYQFGLIVNGSKAPGEMIGLLGLEKSDLELKSNTQENESNTETEKR